MDCNSLFARAKQALSSLLSGSVSLPLESITGKVNPGFLEKADRLFRNNDMGMWTEILQNSRRAGAQRVEISVEQITAGTCIITVQDDGRGILDFQQLLTLGSSGWDDQTEAKEDPAGMGFFSLCRSAVEVLSGTRYVSISPAVFLGKEKALILELDQPVHGTLVRFTRDSTEEALTASLRRATEFYPVEVIFKGEQLPRHDFLEGALYREVIDGIEIGFASTFTWDCSWKDENWNFYGARIAQAALKIPGLLLGDRFDPNVISARFNVLDTGRIKLQLPDRKAIIEDEFFKQFQQNAHAAAYRFFETLPRHVMPYKYWRKAKDVGINLPEAAYLLKTWHASPKDTESEEEFFGKSETRLLADISRVIFVKRFLPTPHTFEAALQCGAVLDGELYEENPDFQGYSWYDSRPLIDDTAVLVDDAPWVDSGDRPEKIEVEISISQQGFPTRDLRLPAVIHVDSDEPIWNSTPFVAVKNSPWDNDELAGPFSVSEFVINATFCPSDDPDSDSRETQRDWYAKEVEREVNRYFRGPRATLIAILRGAIEYTADELADQLGVEEILFIRPKDGSRNWNIRLRESSEQSSPRATT